MAMYRVLRAHRGRYGYMRAGQVMTLPDGYARDLMRFARPLVEPCSEAETARVRPDPAVQAPAGGATGEKTAGRPSEVPPAAGSVKPLSSRHLARRSRTKT